MTQTHEQAEHAHPSNRTYVIVAAILGVITAVEVAVFYLDALKPVLVPILSSHAFGGQVHHGCGLLHAPEVRLPVVSRVVHRSPGRSDRRHDGDVSPVWRVRRLRHGPGDARSETLRRAGRGTPLLLTSIHD